MSRPKGVSNAALFNHEQNYVITPTYTTREELDEKVQILRQKAAQRGYTKRLPQRIFLQILGMRQQIGSNEYKNIVLLDTGERHMVQDDRGNPRYWYMKFTVEKNDAEFRDRVDAVVHHNLNTYIG